MGHRIFVLDLSNLFHYSFSELALKNNNTLSKSNAKLPNTLQCKTAKKLSEVITQKAGEKRAFREDQKR